MTFYLYGEEMWTSNMSLMKLQQWNMSAAIWLKVKREWVKQWNEWQKSVTMIVFRHRWIKLRKNSWASKYWEHQNQQCECCQCGWWRKSRKVVPVMTSMKDEHVHLLNPQSQLAQLHEDEDLFATSLIDRYGARPVSLQNMCLAIFAVTYDVIQSATQKEETDGGNVKEAEMQNTKNDNSLTKMKLWQRIGCHQEEKTGSNIMYKKVQNSYRTRKILPSKATSLLSMA